jgi:hypothetical protein
LASAGAVFVTVTVPLAAEFSGGVLVSPRGFGETVTGFPYRPTVIEPPLKLKVSAPVSGALLPVWSGFVKVKLTVQLPFPSKFCGFEQEPVNASVHPEPVTP